ncbi:Mur ligase middle domain [seawater metagenome]|uniref:Mur ligase middle domain n=1 Tax=seawater metagenome TaxID=1561972 RepID=A0A5E8CJC8_9ZZZZ
MKFFDKLESNEKLKDAYMKRKEFMNDVIGISGTNGKTTTTKLIYELLNEDYNVNKTHENSNSFVGLPWCINKYFKLNADIWLTEIGISKENDMENLIEFINPNIRILTNIQQAHTLNFNSLLDYQKEKMDLFTYKLTPSSILILNYYDKLIRTIKIPLNVKTIICGPKSNNDVSIISHNINSDYISSTAEFRTIKGKIRISYKGICYHTAVNMCLAIACALIFKIDINNIQKKLESFEFYNSRGNIIKKNKFIIYNFAYNCNPSSLKGNLESFKKIQSGNKLIVLGDMFELSNNKEESIKIINYCLKITCNIACCSSIYNKILSQKKNYNLDLLALNINHLKKKIKDFIKKNKMTFIFIQGSNQSKISEIAEYLISII